MGEEPTPDPNGPKLGSVNVTLVVCVLLAFLTAGVSYLIFSTQPKAERTTETRKSAMGVKVIEVHPGTYRPRIEALGVVEPSREIVLSPRISGEVLERAPGFDPGAFLNAGELALKIDPADFEIQQKQRQSELSQAKADLSIEMGRQRIAESDLDLLRQSVRGENRNLVLRQPQLIAAQALVEAAQARVEQAALDVARTSILAPFDAQVLERMVDVGSQVAPGDELATLVGIDTYWVVATVPLSSLPQIDFANREGGAGSVAQVRNRSSWPSGSTREGTVERLIGSLAEGTRLARIVIKVDDPLAREPALAGKPPLIIGAILQVTIEGKELSNVVRLDRDYLRENDTVWLMKDEKLAIAEVEVVFRDAQSAYIAKGLEAGDRVVTTSLATVAEDAPLSVENGEEETGGQE